MIAPVPLPAHGQRPASSDSVRLLDVTPVLGVAADGCVITCGVMVAAFYGVAGLTQRNLAERCGVAWPPRGGLRLTVLATALQHYGIHSQLIGGLSLATIEDAMVRGAPIIGGHAVTPDNVLGHAVVICGLIRPTGQGAQVVVADPNIKFRLLVDVATMVASARNSLLLQGRTP